MSDALSQVLERASVDAGFRAQLGSDPERALAGYALTNEERAALLSKEDDRLRELGVDARVSKLLSAPTTDTPGPEPPSAP
ncbi:MAG TPA: Os1348 family NHLP clan protein [Chloroflexota bacterium]|jgi:hypothetical protein